MFMFKAITCLYFGRVLETPFCRMSCVFLIKMLILNTCYCRQSNALEQELQLKWSGWKWLHEKYRNETSRPEVKMIWTERTEKIMVEEVNKTKCQKLCGKTSSILSRLQGRIGLPVMTSIRDNAMHHPLWTKCREGWGYDERVKKEGE